MFCIYGFISDVFIYLFIFFFFFFFFFNQKYYKTIWVSIGVWTFDGLVESQCNGDAGALVGVEDPRLRADDQLVLGRLSDPFDVVRVLDGNVLRKTLRHDALRHLGGDGVRHFQVVGLARRADPAERSETQRENVSVGYSNLPLDGHKID